VVPAPPDADCPDGTHPLVLSLSKGEWARAQERLPARARRPQAEEAE
jgi:hypothetical protein